MRRLPFFLHALTVSRSTLATFFVSEGESLSTFTSTATRVPTPSKASPNESDTTALHPSGSKLKMTSFQKGDTTTTAENSKNENESSSSSSGGSSREALLAKSWTTVASAYEKSFVPRFAPWTHDALAALASSYKEKNKCSSTSPKALVLCCGPGQELVPIAKILGPTVNIIGIDLAPGMVQVAQRRIQEEEITAQQIISVKVGDARHPPPGPYRVIFSAFGLQQLSQPLDAVREWIQVLESGGVGVILYWPPDPPKVEEGSSSSSNIFDLWGDLVQKKLNKNDGATTSANDGAPPPLPWDHTIAQVAKEAGADVIQDEYILHSMAFHNSKDVFDRMSREGPWHAMRLKRGDDFVDELGTELQATHSIPKNQPLVLQTYARMLVVVKREDDDKDLSKL